MEFVTSEDMKGPNLGFNERTPRFSTLLKYFFFIFVPRDTYY